MLHILLVFFCLLIPLSINLKVIYILFRFIRKGYYTLYNPDRTEEIIKLNALLTLRNEHILEQERLNIALKQQIDYRASLVWWLKSPLRFITRALKGNS